MPDALWLIPAFLTGWAVCYIQMTYGIDQDNKFARRLKQDEHQ